MISYRTLATVWPDFPSHATSHAAGGPTVLALSRERRERTLKGDETAMRRSSVCSAVLGRSTYGT
jgi:hypothetical protein